MILRKLKKQEHFSDTDKAIADYVLNHPREVASLNIRDLADKTYTSPSTIIRLCRKLGTSGYADFKIQFLSECQKSLTSYTEVNEDSPFHHDDSMEHTAANIARVSTLGIEETFALFRFDELEEITTQLANAKSIAVYGESSTLAPAYEFKSKMLRLGIPIQLEESFSNQKYLAVTSNKQNVAILLSYSGESSNVVKIARILKDKGACTICISADGENTLTSLCRYKITAGSSENKRLMEKLEKFSSHNSVQFILNCLFAFVYNRNYENNRTQSAQNEEYLLQFK